MADSDNESGGQNNSGAAGSGELSSMREQDRFLPIANVSRIMKKALPANAKISKDAKETVQECVSEFISFITGEASDKCQREKRKTINGDDLLWAMTTLGFEDYVDPLKVYLQRFRELEGEKGAAASSSSLNQSKDGGNGGGPVSMANSGMYGSPLMGQHVYGSPPSAAAAYHHGMGMGSGGGRGSLPSAGSSSPAGLGRQSVHWQRQHGTSSANKPATSCSSPNKLYQPQHAMSTTSVIGATATATATATAEPSRASNSG